MILCQRDLGHCLAHSGSELVCYGNGVKRVGAVILLRSDKGRRRSSRYILCHVFRATMDKSYSKLILEVANIYLSLDSPLAHKHKYFRSLRSSLRRRFLCKINVLKVNAPIRLACSLVSLHFPGKAASNSMRLCNHQ